MTPEEQADTPVIVGGPPEPTHGPSPLLELFRRWNPGRNPSRVEVHDNPRDGDSCTDTAVVPETVVVVYPDGSAVELPADLVLISPTGLVSLVCPPNNPTQDREPPPPLTPIIYLGEPK